MSLQYILNQVGKKIGLNPADAGQRVLLLDKINSGVRELWNTSDMAGILEEQYFKINANQTISLPDYVGQIRAMRQAYDHIAIKLSQMRPRYNEFNWTDEWRNWRQKGVQPLQISLTNQSELVLTVVAIENPPVVVNVSGPAIGSANISETVTMSSTSVRTVNTYLDVSALTRNTVGQYDVIVSDVDGNQLSMIPNNKLKAGFQIVDISAAPWFPPIVNPLLGWVEVLYKKAIPYLSNDNDEFPAPGYDDVIVQKALQLYWEDSTNPENAIAYYQKAITLLAQIHEDANRGTDDIVSMCSNPHDRMQHRTGFGRDFYYAYRITGR